MNSIIEDFVSIKKENIDLEARLNVVETENKALRAENERLKKQLSATEFWQLGDKTKELEDALSVSEKLSEERREMLEIFLPTECLICREKQCNDCNFARLARKEASNG